MRHRLTVTRQVALLVLFIVVIVLSAWVGQLVSAAGAPVTANDVGHRLLAQGRDYDAALVFDDPMWRGIALFRADRYQRAAASFALLDSIQAQYNLAVSYVHLRRYEDAEDQFRAVLARDPAHKDAQHNLDLLSKLARDKPENEQSGQSPDQGGERQQAADAGTDGSEQSMAAPQLAQDEAEASSGNSERKLEQVHDQPLAPTQLGGAGSQMQRAELLEQLAEQAAGKTQQPDRQSGNDDPGAQAAQEQAEQSEIAIADEVRFRRVMDRPAVVLKARLAAAASNRQGKRP